MKKLILVIVLACILLAYLIYAWSNLPKGGSPPLESGITGKMATEVMLFAQRNSGSWPTNWLQLPSLVLYNRQLLKDKHVFIPEAYAFMPTNLPIAAGYYEGGHYEGNLIVMRREPIKEHGKKGRYFVHHNPNGVSEFNNGWMSEQEVQALFSKFGVKLPDPNPEEVRAAREAVEKAEAEENQAINAPFPGPTLKQRWLLRLDRIKRVFLTRADERESDPYVRLEAGFVRVRPIPVVLAASFLMAIGFAVGRVFSRRKPPSTSTG